MKIRVVKSSRSGYRRIVGGELLDVFDLDYTKPLPELKQDIESALSALQRHQGAWKNIAMFGLKDDVMVAIGNSHIQIIENGKPNGLNWLWVDDEAIISEE